jgi:hypothetical protein
VDVGICFDARLQLHEAQLILAAGAVAPEPVHGLDVEGAQLVGVRVEGVGWVLLQGEVVQERGEPVVQRWEGEGGFGVGGGGEEVVELGWGQGWWEGDGEWGREGVVLVLGDGGHVVWIVVLWDDWVDAAGDLLMLADSGKVQDLISVSKMEVDESGLNIPVWNLNSSRLRS